MARTGRDRAEWVEVALTLVWGAMIVGAFAWAGIPGVVIALVAGFCTRAELAYRS